MIGFYGFNPAQNPSTSRLFGPNIVNQGQQAFQQGFAQFKPFNQDDFQNQQAQAQARAAALAAQSQQKAPSLGAVQGFDYSKYGFGGQTGFDSGMEARMIKSLKAGKSLNQVASWSTAGGKAPTKQQRDKITAFRLLAQQHGFV